MDEDYQIKPFSIILPKTSTNVKIYDGKAKCMYILIEEDYLLKKYNDIWNKVRKRIKKEFYSKPIYNKKILKTKNLLVIRLHFL